MENMAAQDDDNNIATIEDFRVDWHLVDYSMAWRSGRSLE